MPRTHTNHDTGGYMGGFLGDKIRRMMDEGSRGKRHGMSHNCMKILKSIGRPMCHIFAIQRALGAVKLLRDWTASNGPVMS